MSNYQVSVIPTEELDFMKSSLSTMENYLKDLKDNLKPQSPEEYLTRNEAADLLKINLSTLWAWTKKNKLKSYGLSGKVYYKRSEITSALIEL